MLQLSSVTVLRVEVLEVVAIILSMMIGLAWVNRKGGTWSSWKWKTYFTAGSTTLFTVLHHLPPNILSPSWCLWLEIICWWVGMVSVKWSSFCQCGLKLMRVTSVSFIVLYALTIDQKKTFCP